MGARTSAVARLESLTPGPPGAVFGSRIGRRYLADRLARQIVTLGGIAVIGSILAILFVILAEVYPLLRPSQALLHGAATLSREPLAAGVDEYRKIAYVVTASGLDFVSLDGEPAPSLPALPAFEGARIVSVSPLTGGPFAAGLADGRAVPIEIKFAVTFPQGKRKIEPSVVLGEPIVIDPAGAPLTQISHVVADQSPVTAALVGPRRLVIASTTVHEALIGELTREESRHEVSLPIESDATTVAMDGRGENAFVGTSVGQIVRVRLGGSEVPSLAEVVDATGGPPITALGLLNGDRTLIVGDAAGRVRSWQILGDGSSEPRLRRIYEFRAHKRPVVSISPSARHKGFVTADGSGFVQVHYGTTGETLLAIPMEAKRLASVVFAPKSDGLVAVDDAGNLQDWAIAIWHPEVTLRSLFGKVWYEGYERPEYVWQSTGGTDDFEPKLSLTPLVYGTIKGTFYAMLFAAPLALLGALYASQFMRPGLRSVVKPVVEIMAALPSVVLGFVAGLWLAPAVQKVVLGIFLSPIVIPALILSSLFVWRQISHVTGWRFRAGSELVVIVPVVVFGAWLSLRLGSVVEQTLLAGDYRAWLFRVLGLAYDQRNSLVVGMAMGFAVIPIIFTIAEDALSGVPQHLVAGSLALGATPWQTAIHTVLPTASPGIFSALMIGFGRAVGETMIVLMATGNTPIMSGSIFSGFRALSANIAVELPEAPYGGTLYRVLFLAALLLFLTTFVVNTLAELVRLRLRRRYRVL